MDFPFSSLPNQAVGYILMMLPQADRRRLGSTCCRLQYLYKDTVNAVVLSQQVRGILQTLSLQAG